MSVGELEGLGKAVDRLSVTEQMEDLPERVREMTTMLSSLELLLTPLLLPAATVGENPVMEQPVGLSPVREGLIQMRREMDFPEVFADRVRMERELGASCINGVFLDELEPGRGRELKVVEAENLKSTTAS